MVGFPDMAYPTSVRRVYSGYDAAGRDTHSGKFCETTQVAVNLLGSATARALYGGGVVAKR